MRTNGRVSKLKKHNPELWDILKPLISSGFEISVKKHIKLTRADGRTMVVSQNARDHTLDRIRKEAFIIAQ